jgi:glycosyltransferase involved in cell wall biosynthesis
MQKPTLHLLGLFHTITTQEYSSCAFTGKILRFSKMMHLYDWKIIEYGNSHTESEADEFVPILSKQEYDNLIASLDKNQVHHTIGNNLHKKFEERLIDAISIRLKDHDIVCHTFGNTHKILSQKFKNVFHVESGIGYSNIVLPLRIFESYAWMHYSLGIKKEGGNNYVWVIPNYFELNDWTFSPKVSEDRPIVFMGRIIECKGMYTIREIAKKLPNRIFKIAGKGDFEHFFHGMPNIIYCGALQGAERNTFLQGAAAMLLPTSYIEPFGGALIEAQLVGIPSITTNYGAFAETVEQGKNGFRCNTLGDWLAAIEEVDKLDRKYISERARQLYSLETVGAQYDKVFRMIYDMRDKGWYTEESYCIPMPNNKLI